MTWQCWVLLCQECWCCFIILQKLYLHLTLATMEDVHTLKVAAYNWQYRHRSKDNYQRSWCWQNSFLDNGILFHSTEGFSQLLFLLESERNTACFWFPNALVNFLFISRRCVLCSSEETQIVKDVMKTINKSENVFLL